MEAILEKSEIIDAEFVDKTLNTICQACVEQEKPTFCEGNSENSSTNASQCAILALTDLLTAKPKVKKAIKTKKANTPKKPKKPLLTREQKAQKLYDEGVRPEFVDRDCWIVQGTKPYEIRNDHDMWSCSCPDFFSRGLLCKHILLCRMCMKPEQVEQTQEPQTLENTITTIDKTCSKCLESTHTGAGRYLAGGYLWCEHRHAVVEKEQPKCDWFLSRSQLIIV
jgi:SWIM zinc finger